MNKKVIAIAIFSLTVLSLSSCRSKKNVCNKVDTQEYIQQVQQNIEASCVEVG